MANEWILHQHPDYQENVAKWGFIEDHYSGEALKKARESALAASDTLKSTSRRLTKGKNQFNRPYLMRREVNETSEQFTERAFVSRFPRVMRTLVDQQAGGLISVASKNSRNYSDVWGGNPGEEGSELTDFFENADGKKTNLISLLHQQISRLIRFDRVWYLVETDRVVFLDINDVTNWMYGDNGLLSDVIVKEKEDSRSSIQQEPGSRDIYIHYHVDGYDRYTIKGSGKELEVVHLPEKSGVWKYKHYDKAGDDSTLTVPINFIDSEFDGDIGEEMAEGANYLFNLLSDARIILRKNNYPVWVGDVEDDAFEATKDAYREGWNMFQGNWRSEGPDPENARVAFENYKQEVEEYFASMHQLFESASMAKTATEIVNEDSRGRRTALAKLSERMQELENRIWFLYTQKNHPENQDVWGETVATWTDDFAPIDSSKWAEELRELFFGKTEIIPLGDTGRLDAAQKIAELKGINYDAKELEAAIESQGSARRADNERLVAETERVQLINEQERGSTSGAAIQNRINSLTNPDA